MKATLVQGTPVMVDYTPGSNVSGGDVIVLGSAIRIAHLDIPSGRLGSLGAGNAVYDVVKATTTSTGAADGTIIYWDATAQTAVKTSNSGANFQLGYAVGVSADADPTMRVHHWPA